MTPLKVTDAHKAFGPTQALAGVSFELRAGELLGLLGPNGAGKTTIVRAIAGRVRLDAGEIWILEARLDHDGARRDLGVVPQEVALYPLMTASENLEVFGRFHGLSGARHAESVKWALEWTGLEGRKRELVKNFSGGMRRRLNIACGVLHKPKVILLDEPTVGVDPQSRERIYEMLAVLQSDGASLLLTTHQLEEAEARCDRVVIIDHGKDVASGTVGELAERVFGARRTVTLAVDHLPNPLPVGFESVGDGHQVRAAVENVDRDVPEMLHRLRQAGSEVLDLELQRPSLAGVFMRLTGRELRE